MSSLTLSQNARAWFSLARPPFHTVGLLPMSLGMVMAWHAGFAMNWAVFALANLSIVFILLVTYLAGEYHDYEGDSLNRDFNMFSGGSRILQAGLLPRRYPLIASYSAFALAAIMGLIIQFVYHTGLWTIPLGAFGLLCGFFYSSKPVQLAYRGIGEIFIGICYGWLTVNTGYYLQSGHFALLPSLVSIPIGITIFLVVFINEFPDYKADAAVNKRNLVVRFGMKKSSFVYIVLATLSIVAFFIALPYGLPALAAILLALLALPLILNLKALMNKSYEKATALEGICARTLMLNLGFCFIYIVAFALA